MAKATDVRPKITLACEVCKHRNYITKKNRRNDPDRLTLVVGDNGKIDLAIWD